MGLSAFDAVPLLVLVTGHDLRYAAHVVAFSHCITISRWFTITNVKDQISSSWWKDQKMRKT